MVHSCAHGGGRTARSGKAVMSGRDTGLGPQGGQAPVIRLWSSGEVVAAQLAAADEDDRGRRASRAHRAGLRGLRIQTELAAADDFNRIVSQVDASMLITEVVHQLQASGRDGGRGRRRLDRPSERPCRTSSSRPTRPSRSCGTRSAASRSTDPNSKDRYNYAFNKLGQLTPLRNLAEASTYPDLAVLNAYNGVIDPLVQLGREIHRRHDRAGAVPAEARGAVPRPGQGTCVPVGHPAAWFPRCATVSARRTCRARRGRGGRLRRVDRRLLRHRHAGRAAAVHRRLQRRGGRPARASRSGAARRGPNAPLDIDWPSCGTPAPRRTTGCAGWRPT